MAFCSLWDVIDNFLYCEKPGGKKRLIPPVILYRQKIILFIYVLPGNAFLCKIE